MLYSLFSSIAGQSDEELGKKDDDRRGDGRGRWVAVSKAFVRMRRKRMVLVAAAVFMIWFFFTHRLTDLLPHHAQTERETPLEPSSGKPVVQLAEGPPSAQSHHTLDDSYTDSPKTPPPPQQGTKPDNKHSTKYYYEGKLAFSYLPLTMRSVGAFQSHRQQSRNVLFAAASLKSAASLLPIAVEMARRSRNVHVVLMGRNDMSIFELMGANNIARDSGVYFHDARPDFAPYSSDRRAELGITSAFRYIRDVIQPQAVVTGPESVEDGVFTRTIRKSTQNFNIPLIELPDRDQMRFGEPVESLSWISRLDSRSLASWKLPRIEVVIQAPTGSSGPLIRLMDRLAKADYTGTTHPALTIELPSEPDSVLQTYLNEFKWPPDAIAREASHFTIRRRIKIPTVTPEEASVRFVESFYPTHKEHSHVLILSPYADVNRLYFQALRYYVLTYRYSMSRSAYPQVMGISLDMPTLHLNGTEGFDPPDMSALEGFTVSGIKPAGKSVRPPYLWQAPSATAVLYFGEPWKELHSFLSLRLAKFHSQTKPKQKHKLVGTHMPAWSEYVLEFMRARGYAILYLGTQRLDQALAWTRPEAHHGPEEFHRTHLDEDDSASGEPTKPVEEGKPLIVDGPFLPPDLDAPAAKEKHDRAAAGRSGGGAAGPTLPLDSMLPFRGTDPPLAELPFLGPDGTRVRLRDVPAAGRREAESFRRELGGCPSAASSPATAGKRRVVVPGSAEDLFCFGDERWEDDPAALAFDDV
jgi:hypothetical protein